MAFLIALEGIDGAGKGTQARRLLERLNAAGTKTELISFPRYNDTRFGRMIGEFLNGRFGSLDAVSPFLVSLLFAGDRFESRELIADALARNEVVLCDRYVASNIAHQGAKAKPTEREELRRWIETVEFELYGLPRPDLVLLLDLPADAAQQLIEKKSPRDYTDKKADLQEADGSYLAGVRDVYRELADDDDAWHIIHCIADGDLRTIDDIGDEVWNVVQHKVGEQPG
jgi:dTMP kinase